MNIIDYSWYKLYWLRCLCYKNV